MAIRRANAKLKERDRPTIPDGVTFHSLRHTYASLMIEAGADPAYVMSQIGHTQASFTLSVYTHVRNRREAANGRLDDLLGLAGRSDDAAATATE